MGLRWAVDTKCGGNSMVVQASDGRLILVVIVGLITSRDRNSVPVDEGQQTENVAGRHGDSKRLEIGCT
jgi:hypothetical protein